LIEGTRGDVACYLANYCNNKIARNVPLAPKKHIESLLTLEESDNELLLELMRTANIIAGEFMAQFGAARVYTNLGAYQSSKHLHWHIGSGKQLRPY
jgi:histidine triad (HIT) family protein